MSVRRPQIGRTVAALAILGTYPPRLSAQAAAYLDTYREVMGLAPVAGKVAQVTNLVLTRDAGRLTLENGKLYLLSPVGGRTVAAVFEGEGRFAFTPPNPTEQDELARFADTTVLDAPFTEAVLIFADSTLDQLNRLSFGAGDIPGDVGAHAHDLVTSLALRKEGAYDDGVMGPLLNGETSGFFLARIARKNGDPVLFELDPTRNEAVRLSRPVSRVRWGANWAVVTQFPLAQPLAGTGRQWELRQRLSVPAYRLDVQLASTGSANLSFAAAATLSAVAQESLGPWLEFELNHRLTADSARWADGTPAVFFKPEGNKDDLGSRSDDEVWIRAPRRLAPGDSLSFTVFYHGELIDRYGNWFFIDPGASWYPVNGQGTMFATFDITYHTPSQYPLASVGTLGDSTVAGRILTTHWVTRLPTEFATFNLGLFDDYHTQLQGAPPLDVLMSDEAHKEMQRELREAGFIPMPEQSHMRENVSADVSNSLKFFTYLFGPSLQSHFYVTEIPYDEGVSFPGLVDLSWSTFQNTTIDGFDEMFRAHEVAHQWWGNGVEQASYRDKWLTEGLAEFSALWYLQSERKHNDEYFRFFDQYQADIETDKSDAGPIWIGYRNATPDVRRGYQVMIYEKGAWVFHMLRIMMLDLSTMKDDRFTAMMRDYYTTYTGTAASTADFQSVVEKHIGIPMDWFFDEWVKGTGIPTYHVAWKSMPTADGRFQVHFRVSQEHVPADFKMYVPVSVDLGGGRVAPFRLKIQGASGEYVSPALPADAKHVVFNDMHGVLADVKSEGW